MSEANARYEKFLRDVEREIDLTVGANMELLREMKPAVTGDDYSVDWIAPSVKIGANIVDLAGDLMVHWRNFAANAAKD